MVKTPDKREIDYNPASMQHAYLEAIKNLRVRFDKVSDPREQAKIKSDIVFLEEDMGTLDKIAI
jgi:hypothetical protein